MNLWPWRILYSTVSTRLYTLQDIGLTRAAFTVELRIQPKVISQTQGAAAFQSTRPSVKAHMVFFPPAFIMRTINHRIVSISQENRVLPRYGEMPSINYLWKQLYEYISATIGELNRLLSVGNDVDMILHYILSIFAIDVSLTVSLDKTSELTVMQGTIVDSAWKVHVEAFAKMVQAYGGVAPLMGVQMTAMAIRHMFMYAPCYDVYRFSKYSN